MKIIVIGCGRQGAELSRILVQRQHQVTVIDNNPRELERLGPRFQGQIVEGVGFDRQVLLHAGIEKADGLAAVTSNDDTNITTALIARQIFSVPLVIARVYDPRRSEIYNRLGIHTISPIKLSSNIMVDFFSLSALEAVMMFGNGEMGLVQLEIPHALVGRPVRALLHMGEIQVVAITRQSKAFLPMPEMCFEPRDIVHIAVMSSAVERLNALLGLS